MGRHRYLSDEMRSRIVTLVQTGLLMNKVALKESVSRVCVQELVKKFKETGSVKSRLKSGRPRFTSKRENRRLIRMSLRDRKQTALALRRASQEAGIVSASVSTVQRRLCKHNLNGRIAARKPLLTERHRKARLSLAVERRHWTKAQWSNVLWSDECSIELWQSDRRTFVRRRPGKRFLPDCVVPTVKFGGGKIMIWGTMAASGVGSIKVITDTLNVEKYQALLREFLQPDGRKLIGQSFTFQQDGASCHTARSTVAMIHRSAVDTLEGLSALPGAVRQRMSVSGDTK